MAQQQLVLMAWQISFIEKKHQAVGNYQTVERVAYWDGHNTSGELVSSEVYFYRLVTGQRTKPVRW